MRPLPLLLFALCGCAKPDLSSPFAAVVVTYDGASGTYKLAQVRIGTLRSLRKLSGTAGQVRAGGSVRLARQDLQDPGATVVSLRERAVLSGPAEVDLLYSVLNDIVYPEDFQGLELLTAYFNLETSRAALAGWDPRVPLPSGPIVAHAQVTDDLGAPLLGDGELYLPALATFYFSAPSATSQLPPVFNLGAVGHAVGHALVQQLVWGGAPVPAPDLQPGRDAASNTARHLERSLTEGIADYFGVAISGDARWFEHSVQQTAAARDLDVLRCGTTAMRDALPLDDAQVPYDPHPLGTVLAGVLWTSSQAGLQISARGVLAALPIIARAQLSLAPVLDAFAAAADDTRKQNICGLLLNRFRSLGVTALPSCPGGGALPAERCP